MVLNSDVEVAVTEVGDGRLRSLGRCSQVGTGCAVVLRLGAHILIIYCGKDIVGAKGNILAAVAFGGFAQ